MTGLDTLRDCLRGRQDAVDLVLMIREVSHTWDDLIDQDKPVTQTQIHRAFWISLIGIKSNTFYQQHAALLEPILETGILNYVASVELERTAGHSRHLAHTARYAVGDVVLLMARILGGLEWAMEKSATLKLLLQTDEFNDYDQEMEAKYGTA
jgi:hypothetical protein